MRVLMSTKFLPLPADTGGKRRSLAVLQQYLDRGAHVTLCAHDDGAGDIAALERMGVRVHTVTWKPGVRHMARWYPRFRSLLLTRFWSPQLLNAAMADAARDGPFDILQIEYLQNISYSSIPAKVKALDLHDIVSVQTARIGGLKSPLTRLVYALEARSAARIERTVLHEFDVVTCVSETDRRQLADARVIVAPNGWDESASLASAQEPIVSLTANFAFATNEDAAVWFVSAVWPTVVASVPRARLLLVGRDPTVAVRRLGDSPGIEVTGTVPSITPYLRATAVSVAPLRAGGGSRLKILEALEAGRPVVTTTQGLEGLEEIEGRGVLVADEPEDIAQLVINLLRDPVEAARLGAAGREAVHDRFLWSATLRPLFGALERQLDKGDGPTHS